MRYGTAAIAGLAAIASIGSSGCSTLGPYMSGGDHHPLPVMRMDIAFGFPIAFKMELNTMGGASHIDLALCNGGEFIDKYNPCVGGKILRANSPGEDLDVILSAYSLIVSEMFDGDYDYISLVGKYDSKGVFWIRRMIVEDQEVDFRRFYVEHPDETPEPSLPPRNISI